MRSLKQAIDNGRTGHAYLFTGPRGTGKTSTARLLAKALNCSDGPKSEFSQDDPIAQSISEGRCMDVIEMDAASESGVENVRTAIVEAAEFLPTECRYKVFIIDEVHDLSSKAFDALLKTIEEPPGHVVFILATTEYNKVPPTIRSRCQRYDFRRGTIQDLVNQLKRVVEGEGAQVQEQALAAIARMADGGYRDALTLLEQALLGAEGEITLQDVYDQLGLIPDEITDELILAVVNRDAKKVIEHLEHAYYLGRDPRSVLDSMLHRLSDLTRANYGVDLGALEDSALEANLTAVAKQIGDERLLRLRQMLSEAHHDIRDVSLPKLWLESKLLSFEEASQVARAAAVAGVPAASPQSAARTKPQPKPGPKETAPEPKPEPEPEPVNLQDQPTDKALANAWKSLVKKLSAKSKIADQRLGKSQFAGIEDGEAIILFSRQMDVDVLQEKYAKLLHAIRAEWRQRVGDAYPLRFKSGSAKPQLESSAPEVEMTLTGEHLAKTGREVFEVPEEPAPKEPES